MDTFFELLDKGGLSLAILFVLCGAIWRTLTWVAKNVVTPLVTSHQEFVDELSKRDMDKQIVLDKLVENQSQLVKHTQTIAEQQVEIADSVSHCRDIQSKISDTQQTITKVLQSLGHS